VDRHFQTVSNCYFEASLDELVGFNGSSRSFLSFLVWSKAHSFESLSLMMLQGNDDYC